MTPALEPIPSFSPCVQCGRCSAGCPVAFESEHTPRKVIRLLQLEELETACKSPFPWFCATCQACSVRCPQGVDIAGIMLALRREGQRQGWVKLEKSLSFYKAFGQMLEKDGKIRELRLGLRTAFHRLPLYPREDALLLYRMWVKGKIR